MCVCSLIPPPQPDQQQHSANKQGENAFAGRTTGRFANTSSSLGRIFLSSIPPLQPAQISLILFYTFSLFFLFLTNEMQTMRLWSKRVAPTRCVLAAGAAILLGLYFSAFLPPSPFSSLADRHVRSLTPFPRKGYARETTVASYRMEPGAFQGIVIAPCVSQGLGNQVDRIVHASMLAALTNRMLVLHGTCLTEYFLPHLPYSFVTTDDLVNQWRIGNLTLEQIDDLYTHGENERHLTRITTVDEAAIRERRIVFYTSSQEKCTGFPGGMKKRLSVLAGTEPCRAQFWREFAAPLLSNVKPAIAEEFLLFQKRLLPPSPSPSVAFLPARLVCVHQRLMENAFESRHPTATHFDPTKNYTLSQQAALTRRLALITREAISLLPSASDVRYVYVATDTSKLRRVIAQEFASVFENTNITVLQGGFEAVHNNNRQSRNKRSNSFVSEWMLLSSCTHMILDYRSYYSRTSSFLGSEAWLFYEINPENIGKLGNAYLSLVNEINLGWHSNPYYEQNWKLQAGLMWH